MTETVRHDVRPALAPPYSTLIRKAAGVCLILAAITNGLAQYVYWIFLSDLKEGSERIAWGAENMGFYRASTAVILVSALFMPLGLLAIAQVTRWSSPRLTLIGTPLMLWGMWGFHNILAGGYITGPMSAGALGAERTVELQEALMGDQLGFFLAVVPHMLGSLVGLVLLTIAAWRSGAFPKVACALVLAFLIFDFFFFTFATKFVAPHILLFIGWTWLGIALLRMPQQVWAGNRTH
jgi:hypothetical protein